MESLVISENIRRHQLGVAAILTVVMIWSGWIIVSSWGVHQSLTSWDITFLRFTTAAIATSPLLYRQRGNLRRVFNPKVALCGLGCGFPYTMASFFGLANSPAQNAGIIVNGLLPLLAAAIAYLWIKQRVSSAKLVGIVLIGLANALILFEGGGANLLGSFFLLCAALFLAGYTVSLGVWKIPTEIMVVAVPWTNALLFLPIWLVAPKGIYTATMNEILLQVLFQGVLVSVGALFLMTYAISTIGSVTSATFMGIVPIITAVLAFTILHEPLSATTVFSIIICSAGIIAYNAVGKKKAL